MDKPEALWLANELPWVKHTADWVVCNLAAAELRRLHVENASLAAALASSCDEQRHQLWESGGIAGCERARVAERQRDALLEALVKCRDRFFPADQPEQDRDELWGPVNAAIKAVEEGK